MDRSKLAAHNYLRTPCGECSWDLGENYIDALSRYTNDNGHQLAECPECGHGNIVVERHAALRVAEADEPPPMDMNNQGEQIYLSQSITGWMDYASFHLPNGYEWEDVDGWCRIYNHTEGPHLRFQFRDGNTWTHPVGLTVDSYDEPGEDFRIYGVSCGEILDEY